MPEDDRIRRDIEEILERDEARERRRQRVRSLTSRLKLPRARDVRITPARLAVGALLLVAVALAVRQFTLLLISAAFVLLIAAYLMQASGPSARYEKRWRGEIVEYPDSASNKLRRWMAELRK
ncbi:MAG: hypothetical protein ACOC5K_00620 [Chloroflexota bacterium]